MKTIYFDGSPKGYCCCVIGSTVRLKKNSDLLDEIEFPRDFITSTKSQRAEYLGLIWALMQIYSYQNTVLIGDCENVILQMIGINKTRDYYLQRLQRYAKEFIETNALNVDFEYINRDDNLAGVELEKFLARR